MGLSEGDLERSGFNRRGQEPSVSMTGTVMMALTLSLPDTGPKGAASRKKRTQPGFRNFVAEGERSCLTG